MGTYNCQVVNCGLKFSTPKGLAIHLTKKHPNFKQSETRLFPISLTPEEKKLWNKTAGEHNTSLAEYIRFLVREGITGAEELRKAELEKKYKKDIDKLSNEKIRVEKELEAMKKFFIQKMSKSRKSKSTKSTLWMLKRFKGFGKDLEKMEEQYIGNKLIEQEWNKLSKRQQILAKRLINKNIPITAAIKKVNSKCSKDFDRFFRKELISYGC